MNVPKFLEDTELLVRTYEKDIFDKKIGDLCIESTENDKWLECNVDSIFTFAKNNKILSLNFHLIVSATLIATIELGNLLRPLFEVKEYLRIIRTG